MENENYGFVEQPRNNPMPAEMQAQYDRKMAEMRAAERRKHPELLRPLDERPTEEA
jgi:hypothetical protein